MGIQKAGMLDVQAIERNAFNPQTVDDVNNQIDVTPLSSRDEGHVEPSDYVINVDPDARNNDNIQQAPDAQQDDTANDAQQDNNQQAANDAQQGNTQQQNNEAEQQASGADKPAYEQSQNSANDTDQSDNSAQDANQGGTGPASPQDMLLLNPKSKILPADLLRNVAPNKSLFKPTLRNSVPPTPRVKRPNRDIYAAIANT